MNRVFEILFTQRRDSGAYLSWCIPGLPTLCRPPALNCQQISAPPSPFPPSLRTGWVADRSFSFPRPFKTPADKDTEDSDYCVFVSAYGRISEEDSTSEGDSLGKLSDGPGLRAKKPRLE